MLADFTVVLKDTAKHLHDGDAIMSLEKHLAMVTNCTGFLNIGDVDVHKQVEFHGKKKFRDFRAVASYVSKKIPNVNKQNGLTTFDKYSRKFNVHYCKKFERYTCQPCQGALVTLRQQSLLSRRRIKRLPKSEYIQMQKMTKSYTQKLKEHSFGFERMYAILFACWQKLTPSLVSRLHKYQFPNVICDDECQE